VATRVYRNDNFNLPKPQRHFQRDERDCGVAVFAALAGLTYEEVLRDLPDARLGTVTVDGWKAWLEQRGFTVSHLVGCPDNIFPCAHLVAPVDDVTCCHWVYRDEEGDIHDPSPVSRAMPADSAWMKNLSMYKCKVLTLSVSR
jgi:hypothetical protein